MGRLFSWVNGSALFWLVGFLDVAKWLCRFVGLQKFMSRNDTKPSSYPFALFCCLNFGKDDA